MMGKDLVLSPAAYAPAPAAVAPPWPQQPARESEAAVKTIARWVRRNGHLTVPLVIPPVMWLAGLVLYRAYLAGYVAFAGIILAVAVCYFAPHKWDREPEVWYARLSVIGAVLWLIAASVMGPLSGEVPGIVLVSTLAAGTGAWGFFWWRHKRPRGQRKRDRLIAQADTWWQSYCWRWNLGGSFVKDAHLSGVTLRVRVKGLPGVHTLHHFRQATALIESAAEGHADIGLVRIEPVKGYPSEVDIFLKRDNPLREIIDYDPSIAPRSVHEPAPIGKSETGAWKMLPQRVNAFVIGATRTGKSNHLLVRLAALSGCPDDRQILIDLKGGRSARPALKAGCAEYVVTELDEARTLLRMLVAEGKARAKYAYTGDEQLLATAEIPALHLFIDETHGLTSTANGDSECAALLALYSSLASGLEGYVEVYTQFGSLEESVRTEQTRGNLTLRVCYRVAEARHGAYVIPEYQRLDASRLEEKGTCYIKDGPDMFPEQVRAPKMDHDLFYRVAAQNVALIGARPPLRLYCGAEVAYQLVTGKDDDGRDIKRDVTWQEWWDTRWLRLDDAFHAISPQYQAAAADSPHAAGAVAAEARQAAGPVPSPAPGAGTGQEAAARIAADDAPLMARVPDDFRPDPELVRRLPQVIAGQEERFAEALQGAAADSPATPRDLSRESGRSRSWVHDQVAALLEIGYVTQVSYGQYAPVPGMSIRQGLAEVKARNARLAREARQKVNAA
jgi:hypothetical protein